MAMTRSTPRWNSVVVSHAVRPVVSSRAWNWSRVAWDDQLNQPVTSGGWNMNGELRHPGDVGHDEKRADRIQDPIDTEVVRGERALLHPLVEPGEKAIERPHPNSTWMVLRWRWVCWEAW